MMKLVVSDVDGTILQKGNNRPTKQMLDIIRKLNDKGILFAAASGRTYPDLRNLFRSVEKEMLFISSDGAAVYYKGEKLASFPIEHGTGFSCMKDIYQNTDAETVLYSDYMTYIIPKKEEFAEKMRIETRGHMEVVNCMDHVKADYLKLAFYHPANIGEQLLEYLPYWEKKLHLSYQSDYWIEFTGCGVHKATAVEKIMDIFDIKREEMIAFGDNENDKELLSFAGTAYAMSGAKPSIKQLCAYETSDVGQTIERLLL